MKIVKTSTATSRIKRWLKAKGYRESVLLGRDMLEKEFRKARKPIPKERDLDEIAQSFGRDDSERLLGSIGTGEVPALQVVRKASPEVEEEEAPTLKKETVPTKAPSGVKVGEIDNVM